jgi:P-type Cu2+ transporter
MNALIGTRDLSHFVRHLDGGVARMELEVDGLLPAGCTQTIEGGLAATPDITLARVNLADRRVEVEWRDGKVDPVWFIHRLSELGYRARPCGVRSAGDAHGLSTPLYGLAVAVGAALIIRLLPVLAGSLAADITLYERDLFHWLYAVIAVPAAVFAGRPFFMPTLRAAAARHLGREAPVSAAVGLAFALSLEETFSHTAQVSYDSGLILLALVLSVRALELGVQRRAPAVSGDLAAADGETVTKFVSDTEVAEVPAGSLRPGDVILVRPGERIAVDGVVAEGRSEVDQSRVTGETLPVSAARDSLVHAGTLNVSGTLRVRVGAILSGALPDGLATAEGGAGRASAAGTVRLSDRAAHLYPPLALAAALAMLMTRAAFGADWHDAAMAAIGVLVVTYPAAFGLAAGTVEAWAARALSGAGVLLKSPDGIERLARVDTILFDKTGTLTVPEPEVVNTTDIPPERLALAGRLALSSRHPLATAVVRAAGATSPICAVEEPGQGVRCIFHGVQLRLGRPSFCDAERRAAGVLELDPEASVIAFAHGAERYVLAVRQRLRSDAIETIARLKQEGFAVGILSGDRAPAVAHAADILGIEYWHAGMTPADKIEHICILQAEGRTVLMVGDGLNDAPSLAAADAALSVGTAGPLTLAAADGVFVGDRLAPVLTAIAIARRARRLRRQNLVFAAACVAVATPAACALTAGPLVAAVAIAGAAVIVVLNTLRAGKTPAAPPWRAPA